MISQLFQLLLLSILHLLAIVHFAPAASVISTPCSAVDLARADIAAHSPSVAIVGPATTDTSVVPQLLHYAASSCCCPSI